ncbi:MAG: DUF4153 domain-containing protein [Maribacter sp.]|nr:DUF4153 domain-containing protein [Maribacter sp.]
MKLPSINDMTDKALKAFKRFPITLSWAITGSLIFIGIVNVDANLLFEEYAGLLLTFILGISWFIGARFFIEQTKKPENWDWLKLIILGLLGLFYMHLPDLSGYDHDPKYFIRFFLYVIAGHLFLFTAPFLLNWNSKAYWNYLKSICIAIGRSILFSGVLYLGLVLALAAIQALFDVAIKPERYGQLFIFCLGIVNTWTYLSDFPKDVLQQRTINYNKALEVFVKYILIPLVLLYLVILYAYTLKILLEWSLPKGWVSYLVTALAILGFIIHVMVNPIQKTIKSWIIKKYYPWFYILLLPLLVLLFIAIFRRIADYGVTENRYFVLIIAIWILCMVLFLLLSKKKQLKVLPITLCLLALLSSFGFWGAFSISKNSQVKEFQKVFQEVNVNNNIASNEQINRLKSILNYLAEGKSLHKLDAFVGLNTYEICKDTTEGSQRTYLSNAPQRLLDTLGIELDTIDLVKHRNGKSFNYFAPWDANKTYDIAGYDHFSLINFNDYDDYKMKIGDYNFLYHQKNKAISFFGLTDSSLTLRMPIRQKLLDLTKYGTNMENIPEEKLILIADNNQISIKLIFTELGFQIINDSIQLNQARTYLFLKQK